MSLVLGLDTGGTFTDAALLDKQSRTVLATAKSLTTRIDLSVGIGKAIEAVLADWGGDAATISQVTLSTTLATNSFVEGVGGRTALVLIGFDADVLNRAGLEAAIGKDPVVQIAGGHKPDGSEQATLDITELTSELAVLEGQVSSFAVAGHFATRNPGHERAVRDHLSQKTGLPVTCSHELSNALGGPRRALTTVLNARLISLLDKLIKATSVQMEQLGLDCALMVVKGDGTLLKADYARTRPVETVLSGPAASISGAAFLVRAEDFMVSDIGGTTTDIARLRGGVVQTSAYGAIVGGWRTNVEAANIRTFGVGGDSAVFVNSRDLEGGVRLGPRRAIPLSLLSTQQPQINEMLLQQTKQPIAQGTDGRFVQAMVEAEGVPRWLTRSESKLLHQLIGKGVAALADFATTQVALGAVDRLVTHGLVMLSCFTPTDAAHVLGQFDRFDAYSAKLGAQLLARQKSGAGEPLAVDEKEAAKLVIQALTNHSAVALMDAALADDRAETTRTGQMKNKPDQNEYLVSSSEVLCTAVKEGQNRDDNGTKSAVEIALKLSLPLVALGASAATYYPAIAKRLGAELIVPAHAEVAGAVGAAAGAVRQRVEVLVTQPSDGLFRVHLAAGPHDVKNRKEALALARTAAETYAEARARAAGAAGELWVSLSETIDEVPVGSEKLLFLQATITAEANAS